MKVYLAGRYGRREELCSYAALLRERGHSITSRWLDGHHDAAHLEQRPDKDALRAAWAQEDLADVKAADVLVAFSEVPSGENGAGRGGRMVELGAALAWKKKVVVVGPRENLFCCLPQVEHYTDWGEALAQSKPLQPLRRRMLPPFKDVRKGQHRTEGPDTSVGAAQAIGPRISALHQGIYCWLLEHGPATDERIHDQPQFGRYDPRTCVARRRELVKDLGYVEDSGERAPLRSGNKGILWRAIPPELLDDAQRTALGPAGQSGPKKGQGGAHYAQLPFPQDAL